MLSKIKCIKFIQAMLKLTNIYKSYSEANNSKLILENTSLNISNNKPIIVLGNSGSGKTTLLNIISGIDELDSGDIEIFNQRISNLNDSQRTEFRKNNIGFVFQFYNLIPTLTVEENILLPLEIANNKNAENVLKINDLLAEVGLSDRKDSYPDTLSGGEQQRVSLVRALANNPKILIADEPTGNLDKETTSKIIKLIRTLCKESKVQLVLATHNQNLIEKEDTVIEIENKQLTVKQ